VFLWKYFFSVLAGKSQGNYGVYTVKVCGIFCPHNLDISGQLGITQEKPQSYGIRRVHAAQKARNNFKMLGFKFFV
jgi:hypothetical protein